MAVRVKGKFSSVTKLKKQHNLKISSISCTTCCDGDECFRHGRRVVELGILVDGLSACLHCHKRLSLCDITGETIQGLGSILYIKCFECGLESAVPTGKRHSTKESTTKRCFDVNTKLAAAMLNAGVGEQQVNNILAELNLPCISNKTLKKREREIGATVAETAYISCERAVKDELDSESFRTPEPQVSTDGGWQKRGNGRNYNSLSGHVTMIGMKTRKCLTYGVAKKRCKICSAAHKAGKVVRKHICNKSYTGSAKGMEPYLTIKGLKTLKNKGLFVKRLIMDDDTTTFMRAKKVISTDLEKSSDKNHVTKGFTNELYRLRDKNKMPISVINYLTRCFTFAVSQNEGNPEELKNNLSVILPHAYGEHEHCPDTWCKFHEKGEMYKHSSLPGGKDLTDEQRRQDIAAVIEKYTTEDMLSKLTNLQSSNSNENLNSMIARKAPKSQHFSGSDSLDFRVAAAVAQKNEGHSYMLQVNANHALSPGKYTKKRFSALDERRKKKATLQNSVNFKRRRFELKEERKTEDIKMQITEGTTYQTGIETDSSVDDSALEEIPYPLLPPQERRVNLSDATAIIFDIETTGFATDCDIIQIAAKNQDSDDIFNVFVYPAGGIIPSKITSLTGIEVHGSNMYMNFEHVPSVNIGCALGMFFNWLEQFGNVLLLAHNARFDARVFVNACIKHGYIHKCSMISAFVDTQGLLKKVFPGRGPKGYNQSVLVKDLLGVSYSEHNATEDVEALSKLVRLLPETASIEGNTFIVQTVIYNLQRLKNEKMFIASYDVLIRQKWISKRQAGVLSGKGFNLQHLKLIYSRNGEKGLKQLLGDNSRRNSKLVEYFAANV